MAGSLKKVIKEEYSRIKKSLENMIRSSQKKQHPQWVLQPIRPKKY